MQAKVMISKKHVSVLFQSLFTCVNINMFYAKCMYDLSLKVFIEVNSKQIEVFLTLL